MKKQLILFITAVCFLFSCSNTPDKTADKTVTKDSTPGNSNTTTSVNTADNNANTPQVKFTADGKEMTIRNTILVSKDKDKVSPGNDYIALMIANNHDSDKVSLTLKIAFALQPGQYPVVGYAYQHNVNGKGELFGGLLGGATKISPYKVNLLSCEKTREHHWKIAGTIDEISIPLNNLMKLDATVKHPESVTISKISFANMEFDDNLEEMMEKMMKKN
jgi:hypothetical protein